MPTKQIRFFIVMAVAALMAMWIETNGADPAPAAAGEQAAPVKKSKTLLDQLRHGGIVMLPIGICSVAVFYLTMDGILRTRRASLAPQKQVVDLQNLFRSGDYKGAYQYCRANVSPFANIVREGIAFLGEGKAIMEEAMFSELSRENQKLQTRISYLSVIGVCTPMIGLTGTCVGMIKAFDTMGSSGIGDPSGLSAAIGEVLVATASGLFVAIPAFMAYYYLRNRTQAAIALLETDAMQLFRKVPFEHFEGVHLGEDQIYAAVPNWVTAKE